MTFMISYGKAVGLQVRVDRAELKGVIPGGCSAPAAAGPPDLPGLSGGAWLRQIRYVKTCFCSSSKECRYFCLLK
jgi:hypothetical protein